MSPEKEVPMLNHNSSMLELSQLLRKNNFEIINISYGSGGYWVSLRDKYSNATFIGSNHDFILAVNKALELLNDSRMELSSSADADTNPGYYPKTRKAPSESGEMLKQDVESNNKKVSS